MPGWSGWVGVIFVLACLLAQIVQIFVFDAHAFTFPESMIVSAQMGQAFDVQKCGRLTGTWHAKGSNAAPFTECLQSLEIRKGVVFTRYNRMLSAAKERQDLPTIKSVHQCFQRSYRAGGIEALQACLSSVGAATLSRLDFTLRIL